MEIDYNISATVREKCATVLLTDNASEENEDCSFIYEIQVNISEEGRPTLWITNSEGRCEELDIADRFKTSTKKSKN